MKVIINNREHDGATGLRLLDIARKNQDHIGYFCGGNAICQTCYVRIIEGAELLSPPGSHEKAMLSSQLLDEGLRMACLTTIEKDGTIRLVSAVEEVKAMTLKNPLQLPAYQAKMGWEALVKFPETILMQWARVLQGKLNPFSLVADIMRAAGEAIGMATSALMPSTAPLLEASAEEGREMKVTHEVTGSDASAATLSVTTGQKTHTARMEGSKPPVVFREGSALADQLN